MRVGRYRTNFMIESVPRPQATEKKPPASRRFFRRVKSAILRWDALYRVVLTLQYGRQRRYAGKGVSAPNTTLKSRAEWQQAFELGRELHVPLHRAPEKNWDHLAAVCYIMAQTSRSARILDAGAELYSNVLPALFRNGYRDLYGINLSFTTMARRGPIRYLPGDLTKTPFAERSFEAITCLSVLEHGVPLESYFREMHRLLKPGGCLITSVDYYPTPIDTRGLVAHGSPIKVFSKPEIEAALALARDIGLRLTGNVDLDCEEKPVRWEPFGVEYTFLIFTLRKPE
jgi:SAM-dependent methyltransferase